MTETKHYDAIVIGAGQGGAGTTWIPRALRDGVFAHPTPAESLNNLFTSMND